MEAHTRTQVQNKSTSINYWSTSGSFYRSCPYCFIWAILVNTHKHITFCQWYLWHPANCLPTTESLQGIPTCLGPTIHPPTDWLSYSCLQLMCLSQQKMAIYTPCELRESQLLCVPSLLLQRISYPPQPHLNHFTNRFTHKHLSS